MNKHLWRRAQLLAAACAVTLAASALVGALSATAAHTLTVNLGLATPFAILAGTPNITNVPTSTITGNVGLSPATGAGIGLSCAEVTGAIYSVDAAGPLPCRVTDPGLLGLAKNALSAAIGDAAGRPGGLPVAANELSGKVLPHGVYNSAAAMALSGGGTLVLDGGNDPNAVFIFQLGSLLTVSNGSTVSLINQAQSCNVFWQVDSATIGSSATFRGTILAATSITVGNASTIDGRLLANTGSVTLISDTVTAPACAAAPVPTLTPTCPPGPGPFVGCFGTAVPSATPVVVATATPPPAATAGPSTTPIAASTAGATPTPTPVAAAATPGTAAAISVPAVATPLPVGHVTISSLPSSSTKDLEGIPTWALLLVLPASFLIGTRARGTARIE